MLLQGKVFLNITISNELNLFFLTLIVPLTLLTNVCDSNGQFLCHNRGLVVVTGAGVSSNIMIFNILMLN